MTGEKSANEILGGKHGKIGQNTINGPVKNAQRWRGCRRHSGGKNKRKNRFRGGGLRSWKKSGQPYHREYGLKGCMGRGGKQWKESGGMKLFLWWLHKRKFE